MGNSLNSTKNKMFFHYTTGNKISSILNDGLLRRSTIGVHDNEHPVLWFSKNQVFEKTSRKGLYYRGHKINWNCSLQHDLMTNVRFGIPSDDSRLYDWKTSCKMANTPSHDVRMMEKTGKEWGSFQSDWYGVFNDIPTEQLTFQVWDGFKWVDKDLIEWGTNEYTPKTTEEREEIIIEYRKKNNPKGWMNQPMFNEDETKNPISFNITLQHSRDGKLVCFLLPNKEVILPIHQFIQLVKTGSIKSFLVQNLMTSGV